MFYPTASSGSDSTYSCDVWSFHTSHPCVYAGGHFNLNANRGLFYLSFNGTSGSDDNIGARLQELP